MSLSVIDGALVALPAATLRRGAVRPQSAWFALFLPGSTAACVVAITLWPDSAVALGALALVAIPVFAALTLGFAMRGARPWLMGFAPALLALAALSHGPWAAGAGDLLTCFSAVSLAVLVVYLTPIAWLKRGLVAMAIVDVTLVATGLLGPANTRLTAAAVGHLPQLQSIDVGAVSQGYGDLFVASLLGAILALRKGPQLLAAAIVGILGLALDAVLLPHSVVPQTVPPVVALIVFELFEPARGWPGTARSAGEELWPASLRAARPGWPRLVLAAPRRGLSVAASAPNADGARAHPAAADACACVTPTGASVACGHTPWSCRVFVRRAPPAA